MQRLLRKISNERLAKAISMRTILAILLFVASPISNAGTVSIGGTVLEIPNPTGFVAVTSKMGALYNLQKQFVVPTNVEFIGFIPETKAAIALQDKIPDLPRRFVVQTAKTLVNVSISSSDFSKLKDIIKNQNDDLMKKVETDIPGFMEQVNKDISKQYDVNLALSVSQMVPLPVHEETDQTLAYSAYVKYSVNDASGNPAPYVGVVTSTFILVKAKVVFLYSYAEEAGLEWSRDISRQWASAIVAENASVLGSPAKDFLPPANSGVNWGKVGGKAVLGLLVGLIIGLIGWTIKRSKAS